MAITNAERDAVLAQAGKLFPTPTATLPNPIAETISRQSVSTVTSIGTLTSGTLYMFGIAIPAGSLISAITIASGTTAEATGTHLWLALFDKNLTLLGNQGADNTGAAALGASVLFTQSLQTPFQTTYSGLHYIGFCCSAGTPPTLSGIAGNTAILGAPPILAGSSNAGLAALAPPVANALAAFAGIAYGFVS